MSVAAAVGIDGPGGPGAAVARTARLRQENLTDADRNYAIAMHVAPLAVGLVAWPLLPAALVPALGLWLIRRRHSGFDDDHGREVINFGLSFLLWNVVALVTVIGWLAFPVLWVVGIVSCIRGAVAAGRSEYFRYPITIRLLS
jgi:hypothetical protein